METENFILITGATTGIGFATASALVRKGWHVIVHGRTPAKAGSTARDLRAAVPHARVSTVSADLADLSAVRALAEQVAREFPRLRALINNAAISPGAYQETRDGHEMTYGVGYLAPVLLTHLLLPTLRGNRSARVVNVASAVSAFAKFGPEHMPTRGTYDMSSAYAYTKLALIAHSVTLAARLAPEAVTVNALDPGWIETRMTRDMGHVKGWMGIMNALGSRLSFLRIRRSPEDGAHNSVALASDVAYDRVSGKYFIGKMRATRARAIVYDPSAQQELWDRTLRVLSPFLDERTAPVDLSLARH